MAFLFNNIFYSILMNLKEGLMTLFKNWPLDLAVLNLLTTL